MKIYTLGAHGIVPDGVAGELGLTGAHRQAEVLIAAPSKVKAFAALTSLWLAPSSIHDPEFRIASGDLVDALVAGDGAFRPGKATIVHRTRNVGPVLHLVDPTTYRVIGKTEYVGVGGGSARLQFVRHPGIAFFCNAMDATKVSAPKTGEDTAAEITEQGALYAALKANKLGVDEVVRRQEELRLERHRLAAQAVELEAVEGAAAILGVSAGRVYQLSDAHHVDLANARRLAAR
jgi:hypothetical protein